MKIELTKSQISYLKSLDSKKKKRKFLLDCFIENVEIGESEKIKVKPIIFKDGVFETNDKEAIDFLNKCGFIKSDKPNYSPEEIELVKHNINQREVTEQGSELLKFDNPEDESLTQNDLEGCGISKEEDAVKITLDNGIVIWKTKWDILQEPKKDVEVDFVIDIQNYLKSKNIILEINEI